MKYTKEMIKIAHQAKKTFGRISVPYFQRKFKMSYDVAKDFEDLINQTGIYSKKAV